MEFLDESSKQGPEGTTQEYLEESSKESSKNDGGIPEGIFLEEHHRELLNESPKEISGEVPGQLVGRIPE